VDPLRSVWPMFALWLATGTAADQAGRQATGASLT